MANCHRVISPTTPHEGNQNPNVEHHDLLAGPGEACAEHPDHQHPQYEQSQQKSPEQNPDTALSRAPWRCSCSPSRPRVRPRTAAGLARTPPRAPIPPGVSLSEHPRSFVLPPRAHYPHPLIALVRTTTLARGVGAGVHFRDRPPRPRRAVPSSGGGGRNLPRSRSSLRAEFRFTVEI